MLLILQRTECCQEARPKKSAHPNCAVCLRLGTIVRQQAAAPTWVHGDDREAFALQLVRQLHRHCGQHGDDSVTARRVQHS